MVCVPVLRAMRIMVLRLTPNRFDSLSIKASWSAGMRVETMGVVLALCVVIGNIDKGSGLSAVPLDELQVADL